MSCLRVARRKRRLCPVRRGARPRHFPFIAAGASGTFAAYVLALNILVHLTFNAIYNFEGLLVVNAYNVLIFLFCALNHRLHAPATRLRKFGRVSVRHYRKFHHF